LHQSNNQSIEIWFALISHQYLLTANYRDSKSEQLNNNDLSKSLNVMQQSIDWISCLEIEALDPQININQLGNIFLVFIIN